MISWNLKTRNVRPIGLDIGHNSVKMIQLAINGGQRRVLAADKVHIDPSVEGDQDQRHIENNKSANSRDRVRPD